VKLNLFFIIIKDTIAQKIKCTPRSFGLLKVNQAEFSETYAKDEED
jgi:hypothetical protein